MVWLIAYLAIGAFVGFLAGLLGIGGGMTLVPIFATLFAAQGLALEHTVHLGIGYRDGIDSVHIRFQR